MGPVVQDGYITEENNRGIRQLVYTSQTASLAPVNFGGGEGDQSMENLFREYTIQYKLGNPVGSFGAGWDDLGPHSELYWLGWSAVAALSWNRDAPKDIESFIAEFMVDFYGPEVHGMVDVYRDMVRLSDFWGSTWDRIVTDVPGKGTTRGSYGNSDGKWANFRPPSATLLPSPALPFTPGLNVRPVYTGDRYKDWITQAREINQLATSVIYRLEENRARAENNDYNLRVLLTLTRFMRHHARLFINLENMENNLKAAERSAVVGDAQGAVEALLSAHSVAKKNIYESQKTVNDMKAVFAETRVPGYLTIENRYFEQEQTIKLDKWLTSLDEITLEYARKNGMDIKIIQDLLSKDANTEASVLGE
jgi:hypothetical protein